MEEGAGKQGLRDNETEEDKRKMTSLIRKWKRRASMGSGRIESELVQQCKTVRKIRMTIGQGNVVRIRKGRRLELDEGSTEAP